MWPTVGEILSGVIVAVVILVIIGLFALLISYILGHLRWMP
mgnify:CR=1 FL=1